MALSGLETTVVNGDRLSVRVTSSSTHATSVTATLTVGKTSETVVVTTGPSPWSTNSAMPTNRSGATANVVNGKIYVAGGVADGIVLGTMEIYDPVSDSWSVKAAMPNHHDAPTASTVLDKIYLIGGLIVGASGDDDRVDEYNPASDTWISKALVPTSRWGATSSAINEKICVIGGNNMLLGKPNCGGIRSTGECLEHQVIQANSPVRIGRCHCQL